MLGRARDGARPFPDLQLTSAAVGVAASGLAYAWARRLGARPRWLAAHVSALLAILDPRARALAGGRAGAGGDGRARAAADSERSRLDSLARSRVPAAVLAAAVEGAPPLWLAALLAVYGATHLVRPGPPGSVPERRAPARSARPRCSPRSASRSSTRAEPRLLHAAAVDRALARGAGGGARPDGGLPRVARRPAVPDRRDHDWRRPGSGGRRPAARPGAGVRAAPRAPPGAIAAAALALAPLLSMALVAYAGPIPCAALLAAAGAILAARPLPTPSPLQRIRWLAAPALAAAPLVLAFQASPGTTRWLDLELWPVAAAAVLLPFTALLARRGAPGYLRTEVLAAAAGLAAAALVAAFAATAATRPAILAGSGRARRARLRLAAAQRAGEALSRRAWVLALLVAPVAVVPMTGCRCAGPPRSSASRDRADAGGGVAAPRGARDGGVGARGRAARGAGGGWPSIAQALLDGRPARTILPVLAAAPRSTEWRSRSTAGAWPRRRPGSCAGSP